MTISVDRSNTDASPVANTPGRVLVVDDEAQNRALLRDPLEANGYVVSEAANGEQALQMVAAKPPDVILLDLMMPGLNGYEVCRRLKARRETAAIPIVMVTALSERKERLIGIAAGANDFLSKPVDLQDVMLRVRNAVNTKQLYDQLDAQREESERLLLNVLPKTIASRMKMGEINIADSIPEATVLVADLVGFTTLSTLVRPVQVVYLLNELFSVFDNLTHKHRLEKIKTIGDAYMVAGGIPVPCPDHADAVAALALDIRDEIEHFNRGYGTSIRLRIGICTGPLIAGVIGRHKFAYDIWGETVNLACRLEALAEPGSILVAGATYEQLKHEYTFLEAMNFTDKKLGQAIAHPLLGRSKVV